MNEHLQRKARLRREWLLTAAIAFALLGLFVYGSVARPMGNVVYDHFMRLHGFRATQDIVIVAIDDRSLKELGGWPLKRSNYQALLDQLNDERYKPKSIGIDLLFLDPTADDTALAQSIRQHKAVLPLEFKIQDDAKQTYQASPPIGPLADAAFVASTPKTNNGHTLPWPCTRKANHSHTSTPLSAPTFSHGRPTRGLSHGVFGRRHS